MDDSQRGKPESAKISAPPPLIVFCSALLGWGLDHLYRIPFNLGYLSLLAGVLFSILALALASWAVMAFRNAKTSVNPYSSTTRLVNKKGPYRFSRNPMYLALLILQVGAGFLLESIWVQLMVLPSIRLLHSGVILCEEAYLLDIFGESYAEYKKMVRRWL
jgi:protein-S-isoprenylcysteine O-methyltransferase Ste14